MNFYIMYGESCIEDYVKPGEEADSLLKGCQKSGFQFLDRLPLECSLSEYGGVDFPDFIIHAGCIPLVSESMRQQLDRAGVDNLFYKQVFLADELMGVREPYWLALPPRIDCLAESECAIRTAEDRFGPLGKNIREVFHIAIDPEKIGNYQIFKLPGEYENQEIIVTEELAKRLQKAGLVNVHFQKL